MITPLLNTVNILNEDGDYESEPVMMCETLFIAKSKHFMELWFGKFILANILLVQIFHVQVQA